MRKKTDNKPEYETNSAINPEDAYCSVRIEKDVKHANEVEGWDSVLRKKQLVNDPEKNDLMHKFIDKYAEMVSETPVPVPSKLKVKKPALESAAKKLIPEQAKVKPAYDAVSKKPREEKKQTRIVLQSPEESSNHISREEKKQPRTAIVPSQEEGYHILETIHASQIKQRQQKQTNYIIDNPGDIQPESNDPEEISELEHSKAKEKFSQSVVESASMASGKKAEGSASSKKAAHRRMESRSFDVSSIKKIMSIKLDNTDPKTASKIETRKK